MERDIDIEIAKESIIELLLDGFASRKKEIVRVIQKWDCSMDEVTISRALKEFLVEGKIKVDFGHYWIDNCLSIHQIYSWEDEEEDHD